MAKCPKCGNESSNPIKTWSLTGKPTKTGERFKLTMALYQCPNCKAKFRVVAGKEKVKA